LRAWVRAAKRISGKSDGDGLTFTLSRNGTAAWTLRYQFGGRARELTLGRYPEVLLAEAHTRTLIQRGIDIAGLKQTEKLEQLTISTFRELALAWHKRMVSPRIKYPDIVLRVLEKHVFPDLGPAEARKAEPRHVNAVLSKIVRAGAPTVANDALRYLKANYAVE
jgi:hypothetical protein